MSKRSDHCVAHSLGGLALANRLAGLLAGCLAARIRRDVTLALHLCLAQPALLIFLSVH